MSVFDDPNVDIHVGGVEIDVDQLEHLLAQEPEDARIDWKVVERWCIDHPLQVRVFTGRPQQTTTHLRKTYPRLKVRSTRKRRVEDRKSEVCDVLVCFVPEGEVGPFDDVPGQVLRVR